MWSRTWFPERLPLALAVALALACGGGAEQSAVQVPADDTATALALEPQPGDTTCRKTGAWQPCSVLDRLEHAGLVVQALDEPARYPFFSVPGTTYETSRARIHVFLYQDQTARRRDTDRLDSAAVAPRGGSHAWDEAATLVTSNNLAAVVVSPNERQAERIILALSAGLPAGRARP